MWILVIVLTVILLGGFGYRTCEVEGAYGAPDLLWLVLLLAIVFLLLRL